jgi:hypothetical protein
VPEELDILIGESVDIRSNIKKMQEEYDGNRSRISELLKEKNLHSYSYGRYRAVLTEEISMEGVSKELLIKALQEVDIPREKKVFIWNHAIKEIKRPAIVMIQEIRNPAKSATRQVTPENPE